MDTSTSSSVCVEKTKDGVTTITIDRRHNKNAIDRATSEALYQAFIDFENDPSQKVCVFSGAHGTFCAGYDLKELSADSVQHAAPVFGRNRGPMGPSRLQVKKPVICAVSGYAVAGGLELSLLGDIRIVEEDAVFGVFCRRWGVPLIDGGTVRLPAVVGFGRAMDMILTGRPVLAREALQIGLANKVVAKGTAVKEAIALARRLLEFPQACMNADRGNCYHAAFDAPNMEAALRHEYEVGLRVVQAESIAGATRFAEGAGRHGTFEKPKL